jgi:hypothetical protein
MVMIHGDDCKLGCGKSPLHTLHFDCSKTRFNGRCEGSVPAVSFVRRAPTMSQPCESPEKGDPGLFAISSQNAQNSKNGKGCLATHQLTVSNQKKREDRGRKTSPIPPAQPLKIFCCFTLGGI